MIRNQFQNYFKKMCFSWVYEVEYMFFKPCNLHNYDEINSFKLLKHIKGVELYLLPMPKPRVSSHPLTSMTLSCCLSIQLLRIVHFTSLTPQFSLTNFLSLKRVIALLSLHKNRGEVAIAIIIRHSSPEALRFVSDT